MISETFTDDYGTEFTIRMDVEEWSHVQLLVRRFADPSEPFSYGLTLADFKRFAKLVLRADESIVSPLVQRLVYVDGEPGVREDPATGRRFYSAAWLGGDRS